MPHTQTQKWQVKNREGRQVEVEITVDWQALADRIGHKAARNSSGKAVAIHDAVVAKVIK